MRAMRDLRYSPLQTAPLFMGILNVTPDSFSDGGCFTTLETAVAHGCAMAELGSDMIDVGGESTRPGADPVSLEEELRRVLPVIEALKKQTRVKLSVDTSKFEVAERAVAAGAEIINDVSGCADMRMAKLVKEHRLTICLMHMRGTPKTMQETPHYPESVVAEVKKYFEKKVRLLQEMGVAKEQIWVDPGFGFGKTVHHNLDLLRHLRVFQGVGGRLMVGTSRKSFLGKLDSSRCLDVAEREGGTLASNLWAYSQGATVFRVHRVAELKHAIQTWNAILYGLPQ